MSGVPRRLLSTAMPFQRQPNAALRVYKPSVWVEFNGLAAKANAVNLGQGFPNMPPPDFVARHFADVARCDDFQFHQYTRDYGHPRLVEVLGQLYTHTLGRPVDPMEEVFVLLSSGMIQILVTVGAYLSLYYAFRAWIEPGDEVIILEPAYDSYASQVRICGGVPVAVTLELQPEATTSADFHLNLDILRSSITNKTKMIVVNNPHNPTGKLFSRDELLAIAELAAKHDLIVVADEVYEWHVYPGHEMVRFASLPGMAERTITIGSAGKVVLHITTVTVQAFSVTGWKLGWLVASPQLMSPIRLLHQDCIFTAPTPIEEIVARAFEEEIPKLRSDPQNSYLCTGLAFGLLEKRQRLANMLIGAGMKPIIPEAGYFMLADFSTLQGPFREQNEQRGDHEGDPMDYRFVRWLTLEKKLAIIPSTAFWSKQFKAQHEHLVRFCFFKTDETFTKAEAILSNLDDQEKLQAVAP